MKSIKTIALACALAIASISFAFADAKCCEKAKKEGKECTHECCVEAKKAGKTCEKCGGKKKEKEATK